MATPERGVIGWDGTYQRIAKATRPGGVRSRPTTPANPVCAGVRRVRAPPARCDIRRRPTAGMPEFPCDVAAHLRRAADVQRGGERSGDGGRDPHVACRFVALSSHRGRRCLAGWHWRDRRRLAATVPVLRVLHRSRKEGLGPAYADGLAAALESGADFVVQMDCDFSHDPFDLPRLLAAARSGADVVVGSRYVKGGGIDGWSASRRRMSAFGSWYARRLLKCPGARPHGRV